MSISQEKPLYTDFTLAEFLVYYRNIHSYSAFTTIIIYLRNNEFINAIKAVKQDTKSSLKSAKDFVDFIRGSGIPLLHVPQQILDKLPINTINSRPNINTIPAFETLAPREIYCPAPMSAELVTQIERSYAKLKQKQIASFGLSMGFVKNQYDIHWHSGKIERIQGSTMEIAFLAAGYRKETIDLIKDIVEV